MSESDPVGVFLVYSGSAGDRLLFRYPYESEDSNQLFGKSTQTHYSLLSPTKLQVLSHSQNCWQNVVAYHHIQFGLLFVFQGRPVSSHVPYLKTTCHSREIAHNSVMCPQDILPVTDMDTIFNFHFMQACFMFVTPVDNFFNMLNGS